MSRPADQVRAAVRRALEAEGTRGGALALVACSGGPDSMALAAGASQAGARCGWSIGAVLVDHQLQPGSDAVAAGAAERCRGLGLAPVVVVAVDVPRSGQGPEAAARAARYGAFARAARATGAAAVMLAHTMDDQAETVLLGLARGSGARSLAGMPQRAALPGAPGVALLRPSLGLSRAVLAAAGATWGLPVWQDPHNTDPAFARTRVRHQVLPCLAAALGPGVPQALARTAALLRDDDEALTAIAERVLASVAVGSGAVQCEPLAVHHPAVRRRVLRRLLLDSGAPGSRVTTGHLQRLDAMVTGAGRTGRLALPGGVVAVRRCGRLELARGQE